MAGHARKASVIPEMGRQRGDRSRRARLGGRFPTTKIGVRPIPRPLRRKKSAARSAEARHPTHCRAPAFSASASHCAGACFVRACTISKTRVERSCRAGLSRLRSTIFSHHSAEYLPAITPSPYATSLWSEALCATVLPAGRIEQAQPHDTLVRIGVCPIDDSGEYVESAGCRDGRSTCNSCPVVLRHLACGEALPEAFPDVVAFQVRVELARAAGLRRCGELGGCGAARG
jgi:hypothetical protein